jgi:hypothetical protein
MFATFQTLTVCQRDTIFIVEPDVEPDVASDEPVEDLFRQWKEVPVDADIKVTGLCYCSTAGRLFGDYLVWKGKRDRT